VISVYEPPPPPTLTAYRDSEFRGLLLKHIHITYGLSRFCGVCLSHSRGVDIVAASPTTVPPTVQACMEKKQQKKHHSFSLLLTAYARETRRVHSYVEKNPSMTPTFFGMVAGAFRSHCMLS